ncbi:hypothetical protein FRC01_010787, partial [Tulasnella sp. 417]
MLSEQEEDAFEDDASHANLAALANVHSINNVNTHLNSSSDSEFFIRMGVQPRTLFRDYLFTTTTDSSPSSSSSSALRNNNVTFDHVEVENTLRVKANYCSGCGSSSNDAPAATAASSSSPTVTLSYLQPCQHAICHQCFTGMLNIVGEKGLECPMCKGQVTSFDVQTDYHHSASLSIGTPPAKTTSANHPSERNFAATAAGPALTKVKTTATTAGHLPPTFASVLNSKTKMKSAMLATADEVFSSTFLPSSSNVGDVSSTTAAPSSTSSTTTPELPVLRIDNLPWDVTPQMLSTWLHPTTPARIHILLERSTGKTLSHCFVELANLADARTVLRECQNKIIGSGKRTRAVSVTVSSQEEVMQNIFPNWRASFTSTSPSLEGLDGRQTSEVLKAGLLSYNELESLLQLMHNPESHFLKVPTLPFYALVSILQKFPGSGNESSGLFWGCALRDRVFAAVQMLSVRVSQQDCDPKLLEEVVVAATECQAFTEVQRRLVSITANLDSSCLASSSADSSRADASLESESVATPPPPHQLHVNDLEVPPPSAAPSSLLSTGAGVSPAWYSRIVSNSHSLGGSTQPTAHAEAKGPSGSSSLPGGGSPSTTSQVIHVGGPARSVSNSTIHRQHPQFQLQQQQPQQRPEPLILSPPSPTTAGPRTNNNGGNSNSSPRTLFEEIGDDVGVDA